jgi:hypothetical protein
VSAPDHRRVARLPGAPAYFLRIWDTTDIPELQIHDGQAIITPRFENLRIYGFHARSRYTEDREDEPRLWRLGRFPAWCFSTEVPEGEPGFVSASDVQEISMEEFEAARRRGWQ